MLLGLFKYHLSYVYFIKSLYRRRNADNTINASILGTILIILNTHSIVVLLDFGTSLNLGVIEFWKPNGMPKVGIGYIGGFALSATYLIFIELLKKSTSKNERLTILKKIVRVGRLRRLSVFYTLLSLSLFFLTTTLLILRVIPSGGI